MGNVILVCKQCKETFNSKDVIFLQFCPKCYEKQFSDTVEEEEIRPPVTIQFEESTNKKDDEPNDSEYEEI